MQNPAAGDAARGVHRTDLAGELISSEGVEDALAVRHLTRVPCWACIGAARMHRVWIPPLPVRSLHIFVDDDAGRKAADRTAKLNRQLRVKIRFPPEGFKDWAEVAMERTPA